MIPQHKETLFTKDKQALRILTYL